MNNPKVSLTFYESGKVHAELHGVIRDREPQASVKALSFKYFHLFSLCLIVCPQLNSLLQKFDFKSSYQSAGDSIVTSKKVKQLKEFHSSLFQVNFTVVCFMHSSLHPPQNLCIG